MKRYIYFIMAVILLSCTAPENQDDRICLDWDSSIEVVEECTPLYGNIICVQKEKPRYWCTLYEEIETDDT